MTLALYGKSRRRQVTLMVLAIFAVFIAFAGAASMVFDASAQDEMSLKAGDANEGGGGGGGATSTTTNAILKPQHKGSTNPGFKTGQCPTPPAGKEGWWGWHFVLGGNSTFVSLSVQFQNAGTITDWVADPNAQHAYVWTPTSDTLLNGSATINGSDTEFNLSHVCGGNTSTVTVKKIIKDGKPAQGASFAGKVGGQDWQITGAGTAGTYNLTAGNISITETSLPNGFNLVGYRVYNGADWECSTAASNYNVPQGSFSIAAGEAKTVCVMNQKPEATITIKKVGKGANDADTSTGFGGSITASNFNQPWAVTGTTGAGSSKSYVVPVSPNGTTFQVAETSTSGWKLVGYADALAGGACPAFGSYNLRPEPFELKDGDTRTICVMNEKVDTSTPTATPTTPTATPTTPTATPTTPTATPTTPTPPPAKGSLKVTKTVVHGNTFVPEGFVDGPFEACVTGPNNTDLGCKTIAPNAPATWNDLAPGSYTVSETPDDIWEVSIENNGSATVVADETATVSVTNRLKTGNLLVRKVITGPDDLIRTQPDVFQICVTGPSFPESTCFSLNSNGSMGWGGVIVGDYTVTETDPGPKWEVSGNNATVTVVAGELAQTTITNTLRTQQITFNKYICATYGDVPANTGNGGRNDIGKPDHSGFDMTLGTTQGAGCVLATEPWSFSLYRNQADGENYSNAIRTVNAGTVTLTQEELQLALTDKLWVTENYKPGEGYGFGALKCTGDSINQDNLEFVHIGSVGQQVTCNAYNVVQQFRTVDICKVVEENNDGVAQGGQFSFDIRNKDGVPFTTVNAHVTATEGGDVACATVQVPASYRFEVVEWGSRPGDWSLGDAAGYPKYAINDGAQVSNGTSSAIEPGLGGVKVTFFNKATPLTGNVVVKKVVTNVENDTTTFDVTLGGDGAGQDGLIAESPAKTANFNNLLPGKYNVTEQPKAGYIIEGYALAGREGTCAAEYPGEMAQVAEDNGLGVNVVAGQTTTVCVYNQAVGTVIVTKDNQTGYADWEFEVTNHANVTVSGFGQNQVKLENVPLGNYTVNEVHPANITFVEQCTLNNAEEILAQALTPTTQALQAPGQTINFVFSNRTCEVVLGTGQLVIQKVEDRNGNGVLDLTDRLIEWSATTTGPEFPAPGRHANFAGTDVMSGLTPGMYTVVEDTRTGYKTIGVRVDGGALTNSTSAVAEVRDGHDTVVTFFNQPLFNIEVQKNIQTADGVFPGQGWEFTLEGCGIEPRKVTTGIDGSAVFTDVPVANQCQYSVTEVTRAGWIVAPAATQYVGVTRPGNTIAVFFVNIRQEDRTPTPTPTQPTATATPTQPTATATPTQPTATATPTQPTETATPTQPTATPTETSTTEPSTPTPTATSTSTGTATVTAIAGDRTGGTPGAPNSGTGNAPAASGTMNIVLALLGVGSIGAGVVLLSLRRRKA